MMADPERLTDEQFLRGVVVELKPENIRWPGLWTRLERTLDRLAAADNVVEAARNVSGLSIGAWPELADALAAYDAQKEDEA